MPEQQSFGAPSEGWRSNPVAVTPQAEAGTRSSNRLTQILCDVMYRSDQKTETLTAQLKRLEKRFGRSVYSELIHLLSHLPFEPDVARQHWNQIVRHRDSMQRRMGTPVDMRVALLSYFVEVHRKLEHPKIIELRVFEQTQASVYEDELTGLHNYRFFIECLDRELSRSTRYSSPLSLVMVDADNFKRYNDTHGHEAGNEALATIADLLRRSLRSLDIATRYGGEEFALILPSTPKTGARLVAERAREAIERHLFPGGPPSENRSLAVSMGVATFPADAREARDLVRCADRALYDAKAAGKNRVVLYGGSSRSYRRVTASLDGRFRVLAADYHPLRALKISEGGLSFVADRSLPLGSLIDVNLMLPGAACEIATTGRVVGVGQNQGGKFEAAVRITDIAPEDRTVLTNYIRAASPHACDRGSPGVVQ